MEKNEKKSLYECIQELQEEDLEVHNIVFDTISLFNGDLAIATGDNEIRIFRIINKKYKLIKIINKTSECVYSHIKLHQDKLICTSGYSDIEILV